MTESDPAEAPAPTDGDLGPKPDAVTEPGEPNPGGPDAIDAVDPGAPETGAGQPAAEIPDLDPARNPALDDAPDETREGEDTSTEATRGDGDSAESASEEEDPA